MLFTLAISMETFNKDYWQPVQRNKHTFIFSASIHFLETGYSVVFVLLFLATAH